MNAGRVVIGDDNVSSESRRGSFALRAVYEGPKSRENLDVILIWVVYLDVAAAELDLWHGGDAGHWRRGVRQNQMLIPVEFIGEDAAAGPHIDFLAELGNKADR